MKTLKRRLSHLPRHEVNRILNFYDESINDRMDSGMSEEDAVADMGDVNSIESDISSEYTLPVIDKVRTSKNKALWIILIILGSPMWLPLLLGLLACLLAMIATVAALILTLYATELALIATSIIAIFRGGISIFQLDVAQGFALWGLALTVLGVSMLSLFPLNALAKLTCRWVKSIFLWMAGFFRKPSKNTITTEVVS